MTKFIKLLLVAVLLVSCSKEEEKTGGKPEYNLVIKTEAGDVKYVVEEAITEAELQKGLMFRDSLPENAGMIFNLTSFSGEGQLSMWMKDTKIPLDMLFLNEQGEIVWLYENAKPMSEELITPPVPVGYVIELNAGETAKKNIKIGDKVNHEFFGVLVRNGEEIGVDFESGGDIAAADDNVGDLVDDGESEETVISDEPVDFEPAPAAE